MKNKKTMSRTWILTVALSGAAAALWANPRFEQGVLRITPGDGKPCQQRRIQATREPDGAYRYRVPTADIPREARTLDVIPDVAAYISKGPGYWVSGDYRWGRFDRDAGELEIRESHLPIFGVKRDAYAFVAIVKGLRLEYSLKVVAEKGERGKYWIFPRFNIDRIEFDPYEDIVVDVYPLEGRDASYAGMARKYRDWNLARGWVKPLKARIVGNPALAWSAKSMYVRTKLANCQGHARQMPNYSMPPIVVNRTFDSYMDLLRQAKAMGMDDLDMCIVGWNYLGFDGPFPKLWPVYEPLGGEAKMREAIALGKSLGYRMSVHVNNHNIYRGSGQFWKRQDVCKNVDGTCREYQVIMGGLAYHTCFQVVNNRWLDADFRQLRDMGLNGVHHVDVTSARYPTPCHDPRHPANRQQMADWQMKTALKARAAFGGYSSESSFDHFAPALDNVLFVCPYPVNQYRDEEPKEGRWMSDGILPLFPIAYGGIIMSQPTFSTCDPTYPHGNGSLPLAKMGPGDWLGGADASARILKVLEWGGRPTFYFNRYETLEPMKRMYDLWQPLKHLQLEFIDDHREIAADAFVTTWANGDEIAVNYSDKPVAYRGRTVKPLGYEFYADSQAEKSHGVTEARRE